MRDANLLHPPLGSATALNYADTVIRHNKKTNLKHMVQFKNSPKKCILLMCSVISVFTP